MKLSCSRGGECGQGVWFERSEKLDAFYVAPIALWRECDVWDFVNFIAPSWGYETGELERIYHGHNTRFGCWTCTVVRQDRTMQKIVASGEGAQYGPLLEFRNWLVEFSSIKKNRTLRPNGIAGRLTLTARKEIYRRLRIVETTMGIQILSSREKAAISKLWQDKRYIGPYGDKAEVTNAVSR